MEQHSDEKEIRAAIREFCETADLDSTSHRSVRRSVAAKLGIDLEGRLRSVLRSYGVVPGAGQRRAVRPVLQCLRSHAALLLGQHGSRG